MRQHGREGRVQLVDPEPVYLFIADPEPPDIDVRRIFPKEVEVARRIRHFPAVQVIDAGHDLLRQLGRAFESFLDDVVAAIPQPVAERQLRFDLRHGLQ